MPQGTSPNARRAADQPSYSQVTRLQCGQPEFFTGTNDLNVESWLANIERACRLQNVSAPLIVDFIMSYIREPALSVCQAHMKPNEPFTVDDLRTCLLTNYAPLHAEQQARQKLLRLQQRGSVESYGKLFMTLLAKLKTSPMAPADQVTQFLAGLKPQIKGHCSVKPNTLQPWDDLQELYRYCVLREQASSADQNQTGPAAAVSDSGWQAVHSRKKQRGNHHGSQGRSPSQGPSSGVTKNPSGINTDERFSGKNLSYLLQNQLCFFCKKPGHSKQECEDMKAGKPPTPLRMPPG